MWCSCWVMRQGGLEGILRAKPPPSWLPVSTVEAVRVECENRGDSRRRHVRVVEEAAGLLGLAQKEAQVLAVSRLQLGNRAAVLLLLALGNKDEDLDVTRRVHVYHGGIVVTVKGGCAAISTVFVHKHAKCVDTANHRHMRHVDTPEAPAHHAHDTLFVSLPGRSRGATGGTRDRIQAQRARDLNGGSDRKPAVLATQPVRPNSCEACCT